MDTDHTPTIKRAKELLATSRHVSLATVNEDGSPHNSPVRFVYDPKLEYIYWGSHPESLHSQNIIRTGQVFAVVFDRIERGGLYMECDEGHELRGSELEQALNIHNEFRKREGSRELPLSYYNGESPQRMWGARIVRLWVNDTDRGTDGLLIRDKRIKITAQDLLS